MRQGRVRALLQEIDRGLSWLADRSKSVQMAISSKEHARKQLREAESNLERCRKTVQEHENDRDLRPKDLPNVNSHMVRQRLADWTHQRVSYGKRSQKCAEGAQHVARAYEKCHQRCLELTDTLNRLQMDGGRVRQDMIQLRDGSNRWPVELYHGVRVSQDPLTSEALKRQEKLRKEMSRKEQEPKRSEHGT